MSPGKQPRRRIAGKEEPALRITRKADMPDILYQVAIRLFVMAPALMLVAALLWYATRKLGIIGADTPLNARDLRTWPLIFILIDAALFAVAYAVVMALMGDGEWSAALGGGIAAFIAVGLGPLLVKRFAR
jgi:hypothetical protein